MSASVYSKFSAINLLVDEGHQKVIKRSPGILSRTGLDANFASGSSKISILTCYMFLLRVVPTRFYNTE